MYIETTRVADQEALLVDLYRTYRGLGLAIALLGVCVIAVGLFLVRTDLFAVAPFVLAAAIAQYVQFFLGRHMLRPKNWDLVSATAYTALGTLLLYQPVLGLSGAAVVLCSFMLIFAAIKAGRAFANTREYPGQRLLLVCALFDLMLFALLATAWLTGGISLMSLFIGAELTFFGVCLVAMASHVFGSERIATS